MIWLLSLLTILQETAAERTTFARMENLEVVIEANGEETINREVVEYYAPLFRLEQYLESEEFQNNLDVSPSQRADLDNLKRRANEFRSELSHKHKNIHSEAASKEYWRFGDKLDSEALEILLQHQWDRASQLVQLSVLRERGVLAYLTTFAPAVDFELSGEERAKLAEVSESLSRRIDDELKKLSETLLAAVTKSLDARQSEWFKRQCENTNIFSEYLFAEIEFFKSQPNQVGASEPLIETFREHVSLKWNPAEQRWIRGRGFLSAWNAVSKICELLLNDESLVVADFSVVQRAAVRALHAEIHQRVVTFSEEKPFPANREAREWLQEVRNQFNADLDQYAQDRLLERILVPHQIAAIASQAESKRFARMGPIVRLMRGHFDEALKIDDDQRKKIQIDIETAVEDLSQELLSLERSFRKELVGALDDEHQRTLKAAIGDEPQYGHGSAYLVRKTFEKPKKGQPSQVTSEPTKKLAPSK